MSSREESLREILTVFASTSGRGGMPTSHPVEEVCDKYGMDVELRFGRVMRLTFDKTKPNTQEDLDVVEALENSYNKLVQESAQPSIYDWIQGAI